MFLPVPFGPTTRQSRYLLRIEPLDTIDAIERVAGRTVFGWNHEEAEQRRLYRSPFLGEHAERHGSYQVTWTEGMQRPLDREVLWRVGRVNVGLAYASADIGGWRPPPYWLKEALSALLVDVNAGMCERDLSCMPEATGRRPSWWCIQGIGPGRSLHLHDFDPDGPPEVNEVIHLRDLPEMLWLAAGFPGGAIRGWNRGFLDLARGMFEVLGLTEHWLYCSLPKTLETRSQIVEAAASAPSPRDAETLRNLWDWRDRLMVSAEPWEGIMMCRHPVLRGRNGRTWEGWGTEDGATSDLLTGLGDDIACSVLDNIDTARRIGQVMGGLWDLGALVGEPVGVGLASASANRNRRRAAGALR